MNATRRIQLEPEIKKVMKENLRESHKLTFRKEIPSHVKALEILSYWGFSTDFVVECIIKYSDCVTKDDLIQILSDARITSGNAKNEVKNNEPDHEELPPDSLFAAMFDD